MITDKEILEAKIESWKVTVDTQMHFNEMAMKIRHFGFLLIAALVSAAGFSLRSGHHLSIMSVEIPIASILVMFGAVLWWFVMFLDSKWYTPFLVASVEAGLKIEEELNALTNGGFYLTSKIKEHSGKVQLMRWKIDSKKRSKIFHWGMMSVLMIAGIVIAITGKYVTNSSTTLGIL